MIITLVAINYVIKFSVMLEKCFLLFDLNIQLRLLPSSSVTGNNGKRVHLLSMVCTSLRSHRSIALEHFLSWFSALEHFLSWWTSFEIHFICPSVSHPLPMHLSHKHQFENCLQNSPQISWQTLKQNTASSQSLYFGNVFSLVSIVSFLFDYLHWLNVVS